MDLIRAAAFAHIVLAVVMMGLALFWLFMESALRRRHGPEESRRLLKVLTQARWPHIAVPPTLRIPLPWIGGFALAALLVTGLPGAMARGVSGELAWIKVALILAIAAAQIPLSRGPGPALVRIHFALVAAAIVVSAWAVR